MTRPSKTIWITFQVEGIHMYPEALTDPALKEVEFLGHPHRHIFHMRVWIEVTHDNRDLEFILVKRDLLKQYHEGTISFNNKSCEMISDDIAAYLKSKYPRRWIAVEVSEDGENGSYCEYPIPKYSVTPSPYDPGKARRRSK